MYANQPSTSRFDARINGTGQRERQARKSDPTSTLRHENRVDKECRAVTIRGPTKHRKFPQFLIIKDQPNHDVIPQFRIYLTSSLKRAVNPNSPSWTDSLRTKSTMYITGPRIVRFLHIKDLQGKTNAALRKIHPRVPLRSPLSRAKQCSRQSGTNFSFKRPDRTYSQYTMRSRPRLKVIPRHKDCHSARAFENVRREEVSEQSRRPSLRQVSILTRISDVGESYWEYCSRVERPKSSQALQLRDSISNRDSSPSDYSCIPCNCTHHRGPEEDEYRAFRRGTYIIAAGPGVVSDWRRTRTHEVIDQLLAQLLRTPLPTSRDLMVEIVRRITDTRKAGASNAWMSDPDFMALGESPSRCARETSASPAD